MPFPNFLSTAAALWMLGWVSLYWAYTLLGMGRLEALLGRPRRVAFSGGLVVLTAGILVVRQSQGVQGILDWSTLVPAAFGLAAFFYARNNQWLFPRAAARLAAGDPGSCVDPLVAVLPDGNAISLGVLRRVRTAVTKDLLIVHCGLSRSLAAFDRPQQHRPAAVLPHPTGFTLGVDDQRWDGVDGRATNHDEHLATRWVGICSLEAWQARHPDGLLLVPEGSSAAASTARERTPVIPGARAIHAPSDWGRVDDGHWLPLSNAELQQCPEPTTRSQSRYLARWAAAERKLSMAVEARTDSSANRPAPRVATEPEEEQQSQ